MRLKRSVTLSGINSGNPRQEVLPGWFRRGGYVLVPVIRAVLGEIAGSVLVLNSRESFFNDIFGYLQYQLFGLLQSCCLPGRATTGGV